MEVRRIRLAALPAEGAGWENVVHTTLRLDLPPMNEIAAPVTYRTWMCVVCGFIYDEAKGLPEEGIAPGTRWEDIPDTWTCPDCGVTKSDFEMQQA
jgi:rubredoxin